MNNPEPRCCLFVKFWRSSDGASGSIKQSKRRAKDDAIWRKRCSSSSSSCCRVVSDVSEWQAIRLRRSQINARAIIIVRRRPAAFSPTHRHSFAGGLEAPKVCTTWKTRRVWRRMGRFMWTRTGGPRSASSTRCVGLTQVYTGALASRMYTRESRYNEQMPNQKLCALSGDANRRRLSP